MIVGAGEGLGQEFGRLAAADGGHLFLVGPNEDALLARATWLRQQGALTTRRMRAPLDQPGCARSIYEEWLMHQLLGEARYPLDTLINVTSFTPWQEDPWEENGPDPRLHLGNLMELNQLFAREMQRQQKGSILNVLHRPMDLDASLEGMFEATKGLLLDFAYQLNQQLSSQPVHIITLVASEHSFVLQADHLPAHVAPDLAPPTCSASDLADYGYQVARAS